MKDLKCLWKSEDWKLEQLISIDTKSWIESKRKAVNKGLNQFKALTWLGILSGMAWITFLAYLLWNYHQNLFFVASVGLIILFPVFALFAYFKYLNNLKDFNYADNIGQAQEKLSRLYLSVLQDMRVQFLQIPFYTTFYLSLDLLKDGNPFWLAIQFLISAASTVASWYLFQNVQAKNLNKKWVKKLVNDAGGRSINQAADFLQELKDFQNN